MAKFDDTGHCIETSRMQKGLTYGAVSWCTGNCSSSLEIAQSNRINPCICCSQMIQEIHRGGRTRFPFDRITKSSRIILTACKREILHHSPPQPDTEHQSCPVEGPSLKHWFLFSLNSTPPHHRHRLPAWSHYAVLPGGDPSSHRDAGLLLRVHRHLQPSKARLQLQGPDADQTRPRTRAGQPSSARHPVLSGGWTSCGTGESAVLGGAGVCMLQITGCWYILVLMKRMHNSFSCQVCVC